jgi:hypothetical protein
MGIGPSPRPDRPDINGRLSRKFHAMIVQFAEGLMDDDP